MICDAAGVAGRASAASWAAAGPRSAPAPDGPARGGLVQPHGHRPHGGKRLGLHSEARVRFERGVDPDIAPSAVDRFVALLAAVAGAGATGAQVLRRGPTVDIRDPSLPRPTPCACAPRRVNAILGTDAGGRRHAPAARAHRLCRRAGGAGRPVRRPSPAGGWIVNARSTSSRRSPACGATAASSGRCRRGRRVDRPVRRPASATSAGCARSWPAPATTRPGRRRSWPRVIWSAPAWTPPPSRSKTRSTGPSRFCEPSSSPAC